MNLSGWRYKLPIFIGAISTFGLAPLVFRELTSPGHAGLLCASIMGIAVNVVCIRYNIRMLNRPVDKQRVLVRENKGTWVSLGLVPARYVEDFQEVYAATRVSATGEAMVFEFKTERPN